MQDTTLTKQNVPPVDIQLTLKTGDETKTAQNSTVPHRGSFLPAMLLDKQNEEGGLSSGKKTLPSHVRDHFEANSSAFVAFAQQKSTDTTKKIETPQEMDDWDKALLLGIYPGGNIPKEIRISEKDTVVIPKKPATVAENVFPNQILANEEIEPIKSMGAPIEIHPKTIVLPRFIPQKTQTFSEKSDQPTTIAVSTRNNIEETFQKKIIEGQMRGVFENAPAGTRETMEKLPATDILSEKEEDAGQNSNDIWKRRLRDYLSKVKRQRKMTMKNPSEEIEPKENETISEFIQRIYPTIGKNETKKE